MEKNSFIRGFVKGYEAKTLQRINEADKQYIMGKYKYMEKEKISRVAEVKAIRCLLYDREYEGENFTLGEILNALGKNDEQARQIKEDLERYPNWARNYD